MIYTNIPKMYMLEYKLCDCPIKIITLHAITAPVLAVSNQIFANDNIPIFL